MLVHSNLFAFKPFVVCQVSLFDVDSVFDCTHISSLILFSLVARNHHGDTHCHCAFLHLNARIAVDLPQCAE